MRLTRRGWFVLAIVVVAIVSGAVFGPRGLNAVAAPGVVAVVAGAIQARRFQRPDLDRVLDSTGTRGDVVPVRLRLSTPTPFHAVVEDAVGDGLVAEGARRRTTVADGVVEYDLELVERGRRRVGPLTVEAFDVLGLVSTTFVYSSSETILVRPRVRRLRGARRSDLAWLYGGRGDDRDEFDQLREYERGDPVRDIHWKSSAKRWDEGLVVKQFVADERTETVEVAAAADADGLEAMAEAAASIVVHLLDAGVRVGVTTVAGRVPPADGPDQRAAVLDHLALVDAGRPPETAAREADVLVDARGERVVVDLGRITCGFDELAGPAAASGLAGASDPPLP